MRNPLHLRALRPWALLAVACATVAFLAAAIASPALAARTPEPLQDDALQTTVDPAGGRNRDTVEDSWSLSNDMQRMFDRSPETLEPVHLFGGVLMVELPETYMEATIVQALSNGALVTFCAPEREIPSLAADPAIPAILLPIWAAAPAVATVPEAGSSGLEEE